MKTAHTPGPWIVAPDRDGKCVKTADHFYITETIEAAGYGSTIETRHANACLIAAAPDLLAACYAVLHDCDDIDMVESNEPGRDKGPWQMLNEAIAKATGATA